MSDERILIERIDANVEIILEQLGLLNKEVFIGNGHESLKTRAARSEERLEAIEALNLDARLASVETTFSQFLAQCERCKAMIFMPAKPKEEVAKDGNVEIAKVIIGQETELKKTKMIEQWKFVTAVVLLSISTISALLLAFAK